MCETVALENEGTHCKTKSLLSYRRERETKYWAYQGRKLSTDLRMKPKLQLQLIG